MSDDDLVSIIAHGIADAQGDAYAEYSSEFDGYAKAAVDALKKNLAGLSTNGINVWGSPSDIKTVMRALYSDSIIGDVRTNLAHWRDECGKLHGQMSKARADGIEIAAKWHEAEAERIRLLALDSDEPHRFHEAQDDHISHASALRDLAHAEGRS